MVLLSGSLHIATEGGLASKREMKVSLLDDEGASEEADGGEVPGEFLTISDGPEACSEGPEGWGERGAGKAWWERCGVGASVIVVWWGGL